MSVAEYVEPPRGYSSMLATAVVLGAAVALDGVLGGLGAHVVAWLVVTVVLLGVHALVVHASRTNKTLTIDADAIRVGDELIERARVRSATDEVDRDDAVLGWPAGLPAKRVSVTVVLEDGQRARVPTRRPAAVLRTLAVARPGDRIEIRAAEPDDLALLDEIDERADAVFRVAGYAVPTVRPGDWSDAAAVLVAGLPPVGFVRLDVVDGCAHLTEIAVLPGSMRRGIGTRLLEAAYDWARAHDHRTMTLTTYADVPWNAPMYARRGWLESTALGPELQAVRALEATNGLDEVGRRVVMRREL